MAFSNFEHEHDDVVSEINMTPMVDIMLVLLIIFIVTVPVLNHAVNVQLPQARNQPAQPLPQKIEVTIDASGSIYWGSERIDEKTLHERFASSARQNPLAALHLRADEKTAYAHVARVMAASQRAGITRVGFITQP